MTKISLEKVLTSSIQIIIDIDQGLFITSVGSSQLNPAVTTTQFLGY